MLTDNNLLKLMTWNSPNFPIGSFVYSHGLEYSVEIGLVNDQPSLVNWIEAVSYTHLTLPAIYSV